jgi:RNA polymerase sigma-70 factor (ECF subfamily)
MLQYPSTRNSLLVRLRDHEDHEAWSEFVAIYRPVIYRFARLRGLQEADAQDLTQTVFVAVADRIEDWEPDENRAKFRTWLARVATNQAITMVRRRRSDNAQGGTSMQIRLNEHEQSSDDNVELQRQYQREIFRHAARHVREEFEETTWQAFWLTSIENISIADAAASLARSVGSIYTARSRVIHRLQEVVRTLQQDDQSLSPPSFDTDSGETQ